MNELQGLNLIDKKGNFHGIIEGNDYNRGIQKYVICYKGSNGYDSFAMESDNFQAFKSYIKTKSDRFDIIKSKGINHIFHFSPMENIPSILNMGIISRKFAQDIRLPMTITDEKRLDGKLDRISASISYPNYKMRYKLEQEGMNLVIYDISPRILLAKLDTEFYYTNAANAIFAFASEEKLKSNEAFLGMFTGSNREPGLPECYTTDPQAEILVNHIIQRDFINSLILPSSDKEIKDLCDEASINHIVTKNLHKPRCDWRRW